MTGPCIEIHASPVSGCVRSTYVRFSPTPVENSKEDQD